MTKAPTKTKLSKKSIIIVAVVAIVILSLVFTVDGPEKTLHSLSKANPFWLIISVLVFLLSWAIEGLIIHFLIKNNLKKDQNILESVDIAVIGKLFDNLTPMATGGQPVQIWKMHQKKIPISQASSILIFKFVTYQILLILFFVLILGLNYQNLLDDKWGRNLILAIGFLVNLAVGAALVMTIAVPNVLKKIALKIFDLLDKLKLAKSKKAKQRVLEEIDDFHSSFAKIARDKKNLLVVIGLTIIQILALQIVPYFVLLSLGGNLETVFGAISASAFVWLLSAFIPLPGASIGAEGSFVLFFSQIYQKNAVALAMIIWRAITYYLPIIIGFLFMIDYRHIHQKMVKLFVK